MSESIGRIPAEIQPELVWLVGAIITWWARVEGLMVSDLRWLRSLDVNTTIAAKESFPPGTKRAIKHWTRLMRNFHADDTEKLAQIVAIQDEALDVWSHRNAIAHSFWPYGQVQKDEIQLQSIKRKLDDPMNAEIIEYRATVQSLNEINNRAMRLYHRTMALSFNSSMKMNQNHAKAQKG